MSDFWVFGYGSLIWNPGFDHVERRRAQLHGLHRSLCIYSWVHRGTKESPGLVLGLDRGGSCQGIAMRAEATKKSEVVDYLRARELVTSVYLECWRNIRLESGETVPALVYRVDQSSPQYAQGLSLKDQTEIVSRAVGGSGKNVDYVRSTVAAMKREGIKDRVLETIESNLMTRAC
ncbi:MAG: gamma-glutamylcyclotransferase [Pseudomonadota bacterium]